MLCVACANSPEVDELRALAGQTMRFAIKADGSIDSSPAQLGAGVAAPQAAPVQAAPEQVTEAAAPVTVAAPVVAAPVRAPKVHRAFRVST